MRGVLNFSKVEVKKPHKNIIKKISLPKISLYIFLSLFSIMILLPLYILIINATNTNDLIALKIIFLPGSKFFYSFHRFAVITPKWCGFNNSIATALPATLLTAYFGSMAAYGFAKYRFKKKKIIFGFVIASLILPQQIAIVGFSQICSVLRIKNTLLPLIIPSIANASFVFFVSLYIKKVIRNSVMDSARIEGCSEFRIFHSIVLPGIVPAIAAMSILTFITNWNSFLIPMVILEDENMYTVPMWALFSKGVYGNDFGATHSMLLVSIIPIVIVYLFCSRFFIAGLTYGSIKD